MGRTSRFSSARSSCGCRSSGSSPISSRNSVPPSASSMSPRLAVSAPVKAPRTWPNSSEPMRSRGSAPQSTTTNGPLRAATSAVDAPRRAAPCRCRSRPRAAPSPRCWRRGRAGRTAPSCSASRRWPDRSARPRSRSIATGTSAGDDLDLGVGAELELGGAVERDRADARRALEGAVGRIEVGHLQALGAQLQLEVIARHAFVGQPQIVVLMRAEEEGAVVDLRRRAGVGAGDDGDAIATRLERARRSGR